MDCYTNIPGELRKRAQWGVKDAPPKAPYHPTTLLSGSPQPAKAGVRETWGAFESAIQCVSKGLAHRYGGTNHGKRDGDCDAESISWCFILGFSVPK